MPKVSWVKKCLENTKIIYYVILIDVFRAQGDGKARGVLFAGATAGNGVSAGAGLGGETGEHGGVGHAAAGASAGGVFKGVEKTSFSRPGDTVVVGSTNNVIPKEAV